jgi:adenosyl cobinamide kinase/adenosyl cobinamide phosphate guanylyltransferase
MAIKQGGLSISPQIDNYKQFFNVVEAFLKAKKPESLTVEVTETELKQLRAEVFQTYSEFEKFILVTPEVGLPDVGLEELRAKYKCQIYLKVI